MKRTLTIIIIAVAVLANAFSYSNTQKIHTVDSGAYKAMETLYLLSGNALPSSSGPWSEAELQMMLSRVDRSDLTDSGKAWYDHVKAMITSEPKIKFEDNLAIEVGLDVAVETYIHTNSSDFVTVNDWYHSYNERKPFAKLSFETWPTDNFYSYFEFTLANSIGDSETTVSGFSVPKANALYSNIVNTNIPALNALLFTKTALFYDVDWGFPYNAFVSAGGEHWNVMAGRTKLSWGNGETGNLMLSDSFPRHTLALFNTFFGAFKYSLLGTIYPSMQSDGDEQFKSLDGYKALVVHRLEFNLFRNRLGIAINESCMTWSTPTQNFSILQMNPFGFMHNEFISANSNSLVVIEANYTPFKGLNIYGQYAMDEASSVDEGRENPGAKGIMAGIKAAKATKNGILTASLEFVRTDPFLYLRGLHGNLSESKGYGFEALFRTTSSRMIYMNMFTTYRYGNDVQLVDGKLNYRIPGKLNLGFETMLMQHGSMNVNSTWGQYKGTFVNAPDISTPTTFNPFDSSDYDPSSDTVLSTKKVETSLTLSFSGDYQINGNLKAMAITDILVIWNKNNVAGRNTSDMQFTLGMEYSI